MKIFRVEHIRWSGGLIRSYVILKSAKIENDSIVIPPSLHLLNLAKRGISDNSIKAASNDLKLFFQTLERFNVSWDQITDSQMSGYLENILQSEHRLSQTSIERHISTLRRFYDDAENNGLLKSCNHFTFYYHEQEPIKDQNQGKASTKLYLRQQYLSRRLFEIVLGHTKSSEGFIRERDEIVLLLGYHCGLRTSEITTLGNFQTEKLHKLLYCAEENNELTITVPILGKGSKLRHVLIEPFTTKKIRAFLIGARSKLASGYLICSTRGRPLSESHATRVFKNARDIALLDLRKEINNSEKTSPKQYTLSFAAVQTLVFHSLRHTYSTNLVTYCYENGIDPFQYLPEQMGHEDQDTTKKYVIFEANMYNRDAIRKHLNSVNLD
jgi:site-specific recombinase XerD